MTQKVMPYSIEAEETLLGNILLYPDAMVEAVENDLLSTDFYLDKHAKIYSIMYGMFEKREKIDAVSLSAKLKDFGLFDKIGGFEYITQLTDSTVGAVNTKEYIRIIKNKSISRQVINVGQLIADEAYDPKTPIDEVLDSVETKVLNITRSRTDAEFKSGAVVFEDAIKKIESIQESNGGITGVKSCYTDLDKITAGFQPSDFIILAARPSMGKTALALNIALNAASVSPGAVAFFSCEMPAEQLAMRMLAAKAKVNGQNIRTGNLKENEWARLNEATQILKKQKFFIDDTPMQKLTDMLAKCRKLQTEHGLSIVFIDYIQLIASVGRSENRQQEVSEISRRLKSMARELKVPVIALSQLSREVEKRTDKRPMLSDLRETGSLEQDADLVLFLYRKDYYEHEEDRQEREDVDLIIAKHRNGPTDTIQLAFEKDYNAFYSISRRQQEEY
ncbi:MAG: replicative DNA helicase [Erysipelotrichaceae bacterium]|nr:replicative DNA helicase [Erysipelotrichaceae bacterium]